MSLSPTAMKALRKEAMAYFCPPPAAPDAILDGRWSGPDDATFPPPKMTPARKRPGLDTSVEPRVRNVAEDGSTVAVGLYGAHGRDRELIFDRYTWADVSRRFGRHWVLTVDRGAVVFIVCVGDAEGVVALGNYIAGVRRREVAVHRNRDALDMRAENMEAVTLARYAMRSDPVSRLRRRVKVEAA